jgi:Na+-transporting NADH:ubiquinone oxidoreductase subunit NqrC
VRFQLELLKPELLLNGGEIRNPKWRQQFVGKRPGSQLRLDKDIKNISGATLSSRHVTDGVRRLLVTYQMLLANA